MENKDYTIISLIILISLIFIPQLFPLESKDKFITHLLFILPLLGFIIGYIVLIKFVNYKNKIPLGLLTLSLLSFSLGELLYGKFNELDFEFLFLGQNTFFIVSYALIFLAFIIHYPKIRKNIKSRTVLSSGITIGTISIILGAYFFMKSHFTYSIFLDLFLVFVVLIYYFSENEKMVVKLWGWLFIAFLTLCIGDFIYEANIVSNAYDLDGLSNTIYCLAYAFTLPAILSFVGTNPFTLKEVEEKYETLFKHSGAATMIANKNNTIMLTNPQINNLLKYEKDELLGKKKWSELLDTKDRKTIELMLNRMRNVKSQKPLVREAKIITKDKEALFSQMTFSFIPNTDFIVITIFDMTERKKLENELKRINEDLQNFTFTVSHDLKEPLRNISSLATYLKRDYEEKIDDGGQEFLTMLVTSVSTMSQLVDDLLTLSRVGRKNVEFSYVNLNDIVNDVIKDIDKLIKEKNAIVKCKNLPKAVVQRTWMKQVFQNLIANGIKFNISSTPTIEINYENHDFYYEFSIKDNGIGIPKEYQDRIFKLFEQLHPREEYGGTGAGLAIVKKIIKEHKGDIWVNSEEGEGTTFHFTIEKFFIGEDNA